MAISVRLRPNFKLVHEPADDLDTEIFDEEAEVAKRLAQRISHSSGGAFLVTGFRGVGKTTAVKQALGELAAQVPTKVVDVTVPVARPATTTALLFEVTRRLVERLGETGVLQTLSPQVLDPLLIAYARTSLAYSETSTKTEEKTTGFSIGGPVSFGAPKISLPVPKLSRSRKRSEGKAIELAFLAYSEADVEHDFLRIVELLHRPDAVLRSRRARLLSKVGIGAATEPLRARIVVVFDEIDKLTEAEGGLETFEKMLGGLKNLLGVSGVHFVVVGGVDLHDEWLRESATANSLYRSVFAWQGYVGCSWAAAERLLNDVLPDRPSADREVLAGYLSYRGRGIIRNVLYEFNELVEWDGDEPFIEISGTSEERVRLLAEISGTLERSFAGIEGSVLAAPSDNDRFKQIAFFTADWMLRSGKGAFGVQDVMDPARGTPLDLVLQPSDEIVHFVLTALADEAYLKVSEPTEVTEGPFAERHREEYSLSDRLLARLTNIARSSPRARAEFGRGDPLSGDAVGDAARSAQELVGMRYQIQERLGQGGFGTVWRGVDLQDGRAVAIKIVRTSSPEARHRVSLEAQLLRTASSPGVVTLIDVLYGPDRTAIVTDLVGGRRLDEALPLPPPAAVRIALRMLETIEELHKLGIVHADIKPSNVILRKDSQPVLIDLGTAVRDEDDADPLTRKPGTIVGTRSYMSPELLLGAAPTGAADIWALGILLLELLVGRLPPNRTAQVLQGRVTSLPTSNALKVTLLSALSENPGERPSASEMRQELLETREGREAMPLPQTEEQDERKRPE